MTLSLSKPRLMNHSKKHPNCVAKLFTRSDGSHHIIIVSIGHIPAGTELRYDYGDRRPEAIEKFPWLNE